MKKNKLRNLVITYLMFCGCFECGSVRVSLIIQTYSKFVVVTPTQCCRGCLYVNLIRGFLVSHHPQVAFLYGYWQIKYGLDIYFTHDLPQNDSKYRFVSICPCRKFPNCHRRRRRRCRRQCEAFVSNSFCSSSCSFSFVLVMVWLFCVKLMTTLLNNEKHAPENYFWTKKKKREKENRQKLITSASSCCCCFCPSAICSPSRIASTCTQWQKTKTKS